jgi:hypothetical protein
MNVGSLLLSLGIKGDTKSLDDAIKKVEELKKQTQELNKALKEAKTNSKINFGTSSFKSQNSFSNSSSNNNNLNSWAKEIKREEAIEKKREALAKKREKEEGKTLSLEEKAERNRQEKIKLEKDKEEKLIEKVAKTETKEKTKLEKEQKKREKDREKSTKDFFNQIENGFSFIAKTFTGGLLAGGVAGYITSQAASKVSLATSLRQYGISPEKSQRYANVFREASYGQIGDKETDDFIVNLASRIARSKRNPSELLPFNMIGADPSKIKDFDSAIKQIRSYAKNPNYDTDQITSLLGELGLPKEFAPAFTKEFSDKEFENAYKNAKISTDKEVKSAAEINLKISQFVKAIDVFSGVILDRFKPDIEKFLKFLEDKLTPENVKEAADLAKKGMAGFLTYKGAKFAVQNPKTALAIALGIAGYKAFESMDENGIKRINGKIVSNEQFKAFKNKNSKEKFGSLEKNNRKKTSDFIYPDEATKNLLTRLDQDSVDISKNRELTLGEEARAKSITNLNPTHNVNTTVNINAESVDKSTAPFIANEINNNVNKSLYDSKYPTLITPK